MAVDSSFEKFALDTFCYVGKRTHLPDDLLTKWNDNECRREDAFMEHVSKLIICRLDIFRIKFNELEKAVELFKSNDVDFVHYIRENMNNYFPYPRMNIYDKIFMSCAVVIELSELLHRKKEHISFAPHIWSMYFEKEYKKEFYAEKNSWEKLENYAKDGNTCTIRNWSFSYKSLERLDTELEVAKNVLLIFEEPYSCSDIIEIFKRRKNRPLGSFCCSKCLPLFDVLYYLAFKEKLVSDFQLVEGHIQLFLKMGYEETLETMSQDILKQAKTRDDVLGLFKSRIFSNKEFNNSVKDHGGNNCMFCKEKKETDVVSLKSILCRTLCQEAIANQVEEKRGLRLFLELDGQLLKANI